MTTQAQVQLRPTAAPRVRDAYIGDVYIGVVIELANDYYAASAGHRLPQGEGHPGMDVVEHDREEQAAADLLNRYLAMRALASSVRAVRPANPPGSDAGSLAWAAAYNDALRDVEAVLTRLVGSPAKGEGYTAITE
jgi:hypothetical protein